MVVAFPPCRAGSCRQERDRTCRDSDWRCRTEQAQGRKEGAAHVPTGTVKWFNDEKGYGFITPDDGDRDLFVHYSGIDGGGFKSLAENAKVEYEEEVGDKGPKAVSVRAI